MRLSEKINGSQTSAYEGILKSALNESENLKEARSHKEDNEKAAPRENLKKAPRYVKNSPYNEKDIPKRAILGKGKPDKEGRVWGVVDADEVDTYEKNTPDIETYKDYKADAERERDNAKYYNALAKQSDKLASEIVKDRKLDRANKKNESCGKKPLKEELSDEIVEVAEKIAKEIRNVGIMNFQDIDQMAIELLGVTGDEYKGNGMDTDLYACLNFEGINNNWGEGDFFTDEYAKEHPEVLDESEKHKLILKPTSNKLSEAEVLELKQEYDIGDLDDLVWSGARDRWLEYTEQQKEYLVDYYYETAGYIDGEIPTTTDFNDFIWFEADDILKDSDISNEEDEEDDEE